MNNINLFKTNGIELLEHNLEAGEAHFKGGKKDVIKSLEIIEKHNIPITNFKLFHRGYFTGPKLVVETFSNFFALSRELREAHLMEDYNDEIREFPYIISITFKD